MRLGIDLTGFNSRFDLGIGRYISELIPELEITKNSDDSLIIYANQNNFSELENRFPKSSLMLVKVENPFWSRILSYASSQIFYSILFLNFARWVKYRAVEKVFAKNCDVLYIPTTYLNFKTKGIPTLVSLHDLQDFELPENFSRSERKRRNLNSEFTIKFASKIQVSSNFIFEQFETHFPHRNLNLTLIPEGVNLEKLSTESPKSKSNNFLYPAYPWVHKNHKLLFDCIEKLPNNLDVKFILTCSKSDFLENEVALPSRNIDYIDFRGRLNEADLIKTFQNCKFVLSCSRYESSSLPLLEGMAASCVPVASDIPAHREMAKKYEILLFDPENEADLQSKIMEVIHISSSDLVTANNLSNLKSQTWGVIAARFWKEIHTLNDL